MTRLFAGTAFDIPPRCDHCDRERDDCVCTTAEKAARQSAARVAAGRLLPSDQTARVGLEKRKGGRVVTVIEGLTSAGNDLPALLGQLQSACGSGGTVKPKEDRLELQGDHVRVVRVQLTQLGYRLAK